VEATLPYAHSASFDMAALPPVPHADDRMDSMSSPLVSEVARIDVDVSVSPAAQQMALASSHALLSTDMDSRDSEADAPSIHIPAMLDPMTCMREAFEADGMKDHVKSFEHYGFDSVSVAVCCLATRGVQQSSVFPMRL